VDLREFDRILQHTLDDFRLSRGEKRVLSKIVDGFGAGNHEIALLRSRAFAVARGALGTEPTAVVDWLEEVIKALQTVQAVPDTKPKDEAYFSPGPSCQQRIVSLLNHCQRQADICVFTITDNNITSAILDAMGRGVAVRVITDNDKSLDEGSDIQRLQRARIPVRVDNTPYHMHHKYMVVDHTCVLTGSYNWTRSAAMYNEENLVVCHDARLTAQFADHFERLWKNLE
jgi:phosphatidylserine/phosphatidylglycerophosphate/cardiolipin synthase-like enzyme